MFELKRQRPHKRTDDNINSKSTETVVDTFQDLENTFKKEMKSSTKEKFRVNGHRVDSIVNIQNQVPILVFFGHCRFIYFCCALDSRCDKNIL